MHPKRLTCREYPDIPDQIGIFALLIKRFRSKTWVGPSCRCVLAADGSNAAARGVNRFGAAVSEPESRLETAPDRDAEFEGLAGIRIGGARRVAHVLES